MRRVPIVALLLACVVAGIPVTNPAHAAPAAVTYYVSASGSDGAAGTSPATAWRSLRRVQAALDDGTIQPGTQVLFRRNGTYRGSLRLTAEMSGAPRAPVTIGAYGDGRRPVLSAGVALRTWVAAGDGRWSARCPACDRRPTLLAIDGVPQPLARWPNLDEGDEGYRYYTGFAGRRTVVDTALPGAGAPTEDWTGGELVLRTAAWILDRLPIAEHDGATFRLGRPAVYDIEPGYGYFVQDHPAAMDRQGEWVWSGAGRTITVQSETRPPDGAVEVSAASEVIGIEGARHVVIRDLGLSGGQLGNLRADDCSRVIVRNVRSGPTGGVGIALRGCQRSEVLSSLVHDALDLGIDTESCTRCRVRGNRILDTALLAGMGQGGDGHYLGARVGGPGTLFERNVVDGVGYLGIDIRGASVVRQNLVRDFNRVKVDGGGIYSYDVADLVITENIVRDARGSNAGIPWPTVGTHGIYVDDGSANVEVRGNSVVGVGSSGVYVHNGTEVDIVANTLVGTGEAGLTLTDDDIDPSPLSGVFASGNTVVIDRQGVPVMAVNGTTAVPVVDFLTVLGEIDANRYCGIFEEPSFEYETAAATEAFSLAGWQARSGHDTSSTVCAGVSSTFVATGRPGAERVGNGTFAKDTADWYAWPDDQVEYEWDAAAFAGGGGGGGGGLRFSDTGGEAGAHVGTGVGAVRDGATFRLRLRGRTDGDEVALRVYLRQAEAPYERLSPIATVRLGGAAQRVERYLPVDVDQQNALLIVEPAAVGEQVWLDDVSLRSVRGRAVTADDVLRVEVNPSSRVRVVTLDGRYTGVDGATFAAGDTVTIPAWASVVLRRDQGIMRPRRRH